MAEWSDATVLLVIKSRSVPSVGSPHRKWAVGLTSSLVGLNLSADGGERLWSMI